MSRGILLEGRESAHLSPLPVQSPQHPVRHPSRTASRNGPDLFDGLGNGCVGGNAVHEEELVGAQAEELQDRW